MPVQLDSAIFREYDLRGLADIDLTDEKVNLLGLGLGTYYRTLDQHKILIGRDIRLSSPRIFKALKCAVLATGVNVVDLGMVPTPLFYYGLHHYGVPAGIMITGSHNPKEFNGFKVARDKMTIYGSEIQQIRELIEKGEFAQGSAEMDYSNPVTSYVSELVGKIKIKKRLKVAFDPGNGTVGPVMDKLCQAIGLESVIINREPDGNFPSHLPDPTVVEYMEDLVKAVRLDRLDCGIGFDGDGDRIGVVDERGNIVWGDTLLGIFAKPILKKHPKAKIVFEVKCSEGLVEFIRANGGVPLMYKTGHSLIKAKMKEENSPLAGEMSGHIFIADDYYGYDDAIYAALRLLEILSEANKPFSKLAAEIPRYFSTPEIRVPCPDDKKFQVTKNIRDYFATKYKVIDIDGVRVGFADGWGLVRASNTQPVLVMRFEAKSEKRLREIQGEFEVALKRFGAV